MKKLVRTIHSLHRAGQVSLQSTIGSLYENVLSGGYSKFFTSEIAASVASTPPCTLWCRSFICCLCAIELLGWVKNLEWNGIYKTQYKKVEVGEWRSSKVERTDSWWDSSLNKFSSFRNLLMDDQLFSKSTGREESRSAKREVEDSSVSCQYTTVVLCSV